MNSTKAILYIILSLVLIIILFKTLSCLFSIEHMDKSVTDSKENIEIPVTQEDINETNETDETNETKETDEIDETNETDEKENTQNITDPINETQITDQDFREVEEQPVINTQGTTVSANNTIYKTQLDAKQEEIDIIPKIKDKNTTTVLDGVKITDDILDKTLSPWSTAYMSTSNNYMLDNGDNDLDGGSMRFTKRSPACCAPTYPPPFKIKVDDQICKDKDKYVPSPYTGSDNWSNAGCACVTKKNLLKLAHRGGNA